MSTARTRSMICAIVATSLYTGMTMESFMFAFPLHGWSLSDLASVLPIVAFCEQGVELRGRTLETSGALDRYEPVVVNPVHRVSPVDEEVDESRGRCAQRAQVLVGHFDNQIRRVS